MTVVDGRYEILKSLGGGGFGDVYLALQRGFDRHVALKLLRQDAVDEETSKRFHREAKLLSMLNHPNIALFIGHGVWDNKQYTALEFIPGITLQQRVQQGKMTGFEIKALATGLLAGLSHAHKAGVVHRDLKPANIILQDITREPKLIDFGLASTTLDHQRLTQEGCAIGSVLYMAPEQCMGQPVTASVDLYALGCILHECLTGKPLFESEEAVAVMFRQINEQPSAIEIKTEAERQFVEWLERLLQKDPARRFSSAEEAHEALTAIKLSNDDFGDVRTSQQKTPMMSQSKRKNKSLVLLAALVSTLTVGSFMWFASQRASLAPRRPISRDAELKPRLANLQKRIATLKQNTPSDTKADIETELETLFNFAKCSSSAETYREVAAMVVPLPWHASPFRRHVIESWAEKPPENPKNAWLYALVDEGGIKAMSPPLSDTDRNCLFILYANAIQLYRQAGMHKDAYRLAANFVELTKNAQMSTSEQLRAMGDLVQSGWDAQIGTKQTRTRVAVQYCDALEKKLAPTSDDANSLSSVSRIMFCDGDARNALKYASSAISIAGQIPDNNFNLALGQAEMADYQSSLKMYAPSLEAAGRAELLLGSNPQFPMRYEILSRLFVSYFRCYRFNDAIRIAKVVLQSENLSEQDRKTWQHNLEQATSLSRLGTSAAK